MVKALIFDLDDTLYLEYQYVISGFAEVDRWLIYYYSIHGFFEKAQQLFLDGIRNTIFDMSLLQLGVKFRRELIEQMIKIYREHNPSICLLEDAKWAINYFYGTRQLALITDGYLVGQQNKVNSLNIKSFFNVIVFTDEYGRENWKPSSFPYVKTMEMLGCKPNECVYIGDNVLKDFISAKALGWKTIQVCRQDGEYYKHSADKAYQADYKISSLLELKRLLC